MNSLPNYPAPVKVRPLHCYKFRFKKSEVSNKNVALSPSGTRIRVWLCWRGPLASYPTDRKVVALLPEVWDRKLLLWVLWGLDPRMNAGKGQFLLSSKKKPHLRTHLGLKRTQIWSWVPSGRKTENGYAGEGQKEFTWNLKTTLLRWSEGLIWKHKKLADM